MLLLDQNLNVEYYSEKMNDLADLDYQVQEIVNGFIENLLEQCIDFEDLVLNEENLRVLLQFFMI